MRLLSIEYLPSWFYGFVFGSYIFGIKYVKGNLRKTRLRYGKLTHYKLYGYAGSGVFKGWGNVPQYTTKELKEAVYELAIRLQNGVTPSEALRFDATGNCSYNTIRTAKDYLEGRIELKAEPGSAKYLNSNQVHDRIKAQMPSTFSHAAATEKTRRVLRMGSREPGSLTWDPARILAEKDARDLQGQIQVLGESLGEDPLPRMGYVEVPAAPADRHTPAVVQGFSTGSQQDVKELEKALTDVKIKDVFVIDE